MGENGDKLLNEIPNLEAGGSNPPGVTNVLTESICNCRLLWRGFARAWSCRKGFRFRKPYAKARDFARYGQSNQ